MKKLLTVSLVAVMAVSAAHAKIASVEYVEGADVLGLATGETVTSVLGSSVVPAIKALQTATGEGGSVETAINDAIDTLVNEGQVKTNTNAIANMNLTSQGVAGKFVSGVSQSAGNVSETLTDFASDVTENGAIAPTAGAVYTAVDNATKAAKDYTDTAAKADDQGALASGFVKTYVDKSVATIQGNLGDQSTVISQIATFDKDGNLTGGALGAVATTLDTAVELNDEGNLSGGATKAYTDAAIQDLDVDKVTAENGKYFNAYAEADGKIAMEQKAFETTIKANEMNAPTTGAVYDAIQGGINGLDVAKVTAADGSYFNAYAEADGKISMEQKAFATSLSDTETNAPQAKVVKSYTDNAIKELTDSNTMPDACKAAGVRCALIAVGGKLEWEVVEY